MAGLEPADEGVKVPCLTTWLHPCVGERLGPEQKLRPLRLNVGWVKGFEPSTPGTTIRCSNQLSYTHHMHWLTKSTVKIGTPEGTRTPDPLLRRQLLYPPELQAHTGAGDGNRTHATSLEGWDSTIELHPHGCRVPLTSATICYHISAVLSMAFEKIPDLFIKWRCRRRRSSPRRPPAAPGAGDSAPSG